MQQFESESRLTVLRVTILTPDYKYPNRRTILSIDHGVGKVLEYVNSPNVVSRCTEVGKLNEQLHYSVVLVKEPAGELRSTFPSIEARCFEEI